jgi:hypothetical protein
MMRFVRWISRLSVVLPVAVVSLYSPSFHSVDQSALAAGGPITFTVEELDGSQFIYVVFHALDRDGFCSAPDGAVSLHPVLNMPVDFQIEAGDGVIIESSAALASFGRHADDVPTFSTGVNAAAGSPILAFPPLVSGVTDECQAWVRVSQSIPGPLRVMVTAPSDDGAGSVAFIADLERPAPETGVTLNFRWSLVTWNGSDGVTPSAALKGPSGGSDITPQVSAIYGWDAVTQSWRAFFPSGAGVPGANDLASLKAGAAYWVAVNGPGNVTWVTS